MLQNTMALGLCRLLRVYWMVSKFSIQKRDFGTLLSKAPSAHQKAFAFLVAQAPKLLIKKASLLKLSNTELKMLLYKPLLLFRYIMSGSLPITVGYDCYDTPCFGPECQVMGQWRMIGSRDLSREGCRYWSEAFVIPQWFLNHPSS